MSDFEYTQNNDQWAREKGLMRTCPDCKKKYDPHTDHRNSCPERLKKEKEREARLIQAAKEREEQANLQEEKEKQLKNAFDSIIWPDNKPPKMS